MLTISDKQTVEYIQAQLKELALLSSKSGFSSLAYLIAIAELEAESQCQCSDIETKQAKT